MPLIPAHLTLDRGNPAAELVPVKLSVTTNRELLIEFDSGTVWALNLDQAPAAYLAGRLALASGVAFGEWFDRGITKLENELEETA